MNPKFPLAVLLSILLTSCATAQSGAMSLARKAELRGDFHECLHHLANAESYGDFAETKNAQIAFQRGMCLEGLGRKSEALAMYRHVIARYADSSWSAQAKGRLESHARPN